jgi:hypothetical protein
MSGTFRTTERHLRLLSTGAEVAGEERLILPPSPRLTEFLEAAAQAGLEAAEAVCLALERALSLSDAAAFGLDAEDARRRLWQAARGAQARRALTPSQSAYIRRLQGAKPLPAADTSDGLVVALPDRVLTRVRDEIGERAIRRDVVEEMVSWELAATLEGRTLNEWALRTLAERSTAA